VPGPPPSFTPPGSTAATPLIFNSDANTACRWVVPRPSWRARADGRWTPLLLRASNSVSASRRQSDDLCSVGNGIMKPTTASAQLGRCSVAPLCPQTVQRARSRSTSLDASRPQRMTATAHASGAWCWRRSQFSHSHGVARCRPRVVVAGDVFMAPIGRPPAAPSPAASDCVSAPTPPERPRSALAHARSREEMPARDTRAWH
jgi:hypothetical protein